MWSLSPGGHAPSYHLRFCYRKWRGSGRWRKQLYPLPYKVILKSTRTCGLIIVLLRPPWDWFGRVSWVGIIDVLPKHTGAFSLAPLFSINVFVFNWRIIALPCCFGHTSKWISHRYTYVSSLPPPIPPHPARLSQSTGLSSLSHIANFHWLSILHVVEYMFFTLLSVRPTISVPHCVHKSVLYVWVSVAVLQLDFANLATLSPFLYNHLKLFFLKLQT